MDTQNSNIIVKKFDSAENRVSKIYINETECTENYKEILEKYPVTSLQNLIKEIIMDVETSVQNNTEKALKGPYYRECMASLNVIKNMYNSLDYFVKTLSKDTCITELDIFIKEIQKQKNDLILIIYDYDNSTRKNILN